jgi:AcrR family transcriptional regulator
MSPARRTSAETEELRTSLLAAARQIIVRDGPAALTMRALATEADCAVGLPYKVFADRHELVGDILHAEFLTLEARFRAMAGRVGTGTVGANLAWLSEVLLDSPAVALAHEVIGDERLAKAFTERIHHTGVGPAAFETAFTDYLAAEQRAGRVDADVDARAFGFLLAGAVHNLMISGEAYPRPTRRRLRQLLAATAAAIAPRA